MHKKYLPLTLVLVALLALLAATGYRAMTRTAPTIGLAAEKQIYLTFDDGPSTVVTGQILDTLKAENVKATFFIVSDRVKGREETLRRAAREGHTLGVHSANHVYTQIYASEEAFLHDVEECASVIERVAGVKPNVYRFPGGGGQNRGAYADLLKQRGYRVVAWNAVCGDEEIPRASAETLLRESVDTARGKQPVVLLMHDSATHRETAAALPGIIAYFKGQGYAFCKY